MSDDLVDRIRENAMRLGGLSWVADLFDRRGRLNTENQECKYLLYCEILAQQEELLRQLKNKSL